MKYRLPDGQEVTGNSYTDIVMAMNEQKMTPSKRLSTYRKALAERARLVYQADIDDTSDKTLIQSMEKCGLIERL
jgi:hypothetical protein